MVARTALVLPKRRANFSTRRDLKIGICAACHPFFTGEQKFVDTAGRVEPTRYTAPQAQVTVVWM